MVGDFRLIKHTFDHVMADKMAYYMNTSTGFLSANVMKGVTNKSIQSALDSIPEVASIPDVNAIMTPDGSTQMKQALDTAMNEAPSMTQMANTGADLFTSFLG